MPRRKTSKSKPVRNRTTVKHRPLTSEEEREDRLADLGLPVQKLSFNSIFSCIGGAEIALSQMKYLPLPADFVAFIDDYNNLSSKERQVLDIDEFIHAHGLNISAVAGKVVECLVAVGHDMTQAIRAAGMPILVATSMKHAQDPIMGETERGRWLQAGGFHPTPKAAQQINITTQANAASASAAERGLPSFSDTLSLASPEHRALPPADCDVIDITTDVLEADHSVES